MLKPIITLCLILLSILSIESRDLYFKNTKGQSIKIRLYEYNGESRLVVVDPYYVDTKLVDVRHGIYEYSHWKVIFDLLNGSTVSYIEPKVYLDVDYEWVDFKGIRYDIPISGTEYESRHKKVTTPAGNGGSINGNNSAPSRSTNGSHNTSSRCKYCNGTGNCSSCHGKGYKFNSYSGHDDTCPSCSGSGRCFNCHGSGRQR